LSVEFRQRQAEPGYIAQLLTTPDERFIRPSVQKLVEIEPWGLDINMGCPVPHTLRHLWGSRLLDHPDEAAGIMKLVRSLTLLPLSAKLRCADKAPDAESRLASLAQRLAAEGADWLTIHARPRDDGHKGHADWGLVGRIRRQLNIPVVANGDIQTADDALNVIREHEVDGAMIGRALAARPWIFWQIANQLGLNSAPTGRSGEFAPTAGEQESREYFRAALLFLDLLQRDYPTDDLVLKRFRFFVQTGSPWFTYGHSLWAMTTKHKTVGALREGLERHAEKATHPIAQRVKFW
jgi:tRNA-dihydrouridine synthase